MYKWIIGIDEVGRGPLAGPVALGAVAMPVELHEWSNWEGLKDSKKLSEKRREEWYGTASGDERLKWAVAATGARIIDTKGIVFAIRDAARRAIEKLGISPDEASVLLDKGIQLPLEWQQEQFVKGDEHYPAIALASIMAKVTRDRYMVGLATQYPVYGFESHKGYGTAVHIAAIRAHGQVPHIHRASFLKNLVKE